MAIVATPGDRLIGRIPVRNLWFLMLYASDLTRIKGSFDAMTENDVDDLPDLVARLLADSVELRIRRNLTRGYRHREIACNRVRGSIDVLKTESRQLLCRGEVFCRFAELTNDTPRNRFVRSALNLMARFVRKNELCQRCRSIAFNMGRMGVSDGRPSRAELALDRIGRNDSADRFMIALARLAFDLALPTEDSGSTPLAKADREEYWVRHLFEKAVLGFARVELEPLGWRVRGGTPLNWQISFASEGLTGILPGMKTDIVLDPPGDYRRIVIDTKFASILVVDRFERALLKSGYLYQMYAYLRSQEGCEPRWDTAAGLFLHPATDTTLRKHVVIQCHPILFATINLSGHPSAIREELRLVLSQAKISATSSAAEPGKGMDCPGP